jgi:hypothetical protein
MTSSSASSKHPRSAGSDPGSVRERSVVPPCTSARSARKKAFGGGAYVNLAAGSGHLGLLSSGSPDVELDQYLVERDPSSLLVIDRRSRFLSSRCTPWVSAGPANRGPRARPRDRRSLVSSDPCWWAGARGSTIPLHIALSVGPPDRPTEVELVPALVDGGARPRPPACGILHARRAHPAAHRAAGSSKRPRPITRTNPAPF